MEQQQPPPAAAADGVQHNQPPAAVILDLDGLLLDTESLCVEVAQQVLARHGKDLSHAAQRAALGRRPLDCWREVASIVGLLDAVTPEQLVAESEPLLAARWADVRPLPGARRLLEHLRAAGVKTAIATSTSRATFDAKLSKKPWMRELFQASACGDEVACGKPAPDVFLAAAQLLGVDPRQCLAFEDAPSGAAGAVAAGMRTVFVPSMVGKEQQQDSIQDVTAAGGQGGGPGAVVEVLPSLLAFDPTRHGLPPFADVVAGGVIPVSPPFYIRGRVVKGFGRGSKELGIPTANVDADALRSSLAEAVTGIYCGWASIGSSEQTYKMCMSIGWNPVFGNKEKSAEPWILHEFDEPFYDQEIRLVVCGYIRPEADFTSLEALVARIRKDGEVSAEALAASPALRALADDPFLLPSPQQLEQLQPPPPSETAAVAREMAADMDGADREGEVAAGLGAC